MNWFQADEREFAEYDIDIQAWMRPKPFGVSGCFRLRDESQFMEQAILSHLPYLTEAVLIVQESADNTVELAYELAARDEKIRVVEYPVIPHFIDHPEFFTEPTNSIYSFVYLSNWALAQCRYSWIAKTEGDVICLSSFANIIDQINAHPGEPRLYGRVILNVAGAGCNQVSWDNPRNGGWDEAVFPNNPNYVHFVRRDKWEVLDAVIPQSCMGWSALHMKRCKREMLPVWNNETYVPFDREHVRLAVADYNRRAGGYPASDDPLGADCIYEEDWL